jgi:TolA-binding protein
LAAAERFGFARACQLATAKELLGLADAGRFFGPDRRAVMALQVLRQRFPGSIDAGTAAFTLGRIAFERQHAYTEAANWFETYVREQPSGPLMGDAFGRLMEAKLRSGDLTSARANAQQYLRRFPEGPYASEARGVLSR